MNRDVAVRTLHEAEVARRAAEARDAALQVATSSFRDALTEPLFDNGVPGPSLAETANVTVTDETRNFQIQYGIRDEMRRWLVPTDHRPTCPLDQRPCTSWTCLVDVCVDERTR